MDIKRIRQRRILSLTGFTLLELIIVIVIVGILAAAGIPMYITAIEKARGNECITNTKIALTAWRIHNMARTPYTTNGYQNMEQLNNRFGTSITENYFSISGATNSTNCRYWLASNTNAGNNSFLRINAYRISKSSNNRISCTYYYSRNANIWDWSAGNWPWPPED